MLLAKIKTTFIWFTDIIYDRRANIKKPKKCHVEAIEKRLTQK